MISKGSAQPSRSAQSVRTASDPSELERALSEAIRAAVETWSKFYAASYHFDRAVMDCGNRGEDLSMVLAAGRDGALLAYALVLDGILSHLRRMRREVRR